MSIEPEKAELKQLQSRRLTIADVLYFSGMRLAICAVVIVAVSRRAERPDPERIKGLSYDSIDRAVIRASWDARDVAATLVALGLVAAVYI